MEQNSQELIEMRLLPPEEVRQILGISQWSFDRLVRRGELNAAKLGRRRYVTFHNLREYFNTLNTGKGNVYGIKK